MRLLEVRLTALAAVLLLAGCTNEGPNSTAALDQGTRPGGQVLSTRDVTRQTSPETQEPGSEPVGLSPTLASKTNEPRPTETKSDTADQDQSEAGVEEAQYVASGNIADFWWSADSSVLFYVLKGGVYGYDLTQDEVVESTSDSLATSSASTDFQLPLEADWSSVSPSGDRALYTVVASPAPTPTPPENPVDAGETSPKGEDAQLWLWEQGTSRILTEIEDCIGSYEWTLDERYVVISSPPVPAHCTETYAWLVDLETYTVSSLLPKTQYESELTIYGISPDGTRLLFGSGSSLATIDLETSQVTFLETPAGAHGEWLNETTLLISYRIDADVPRVIGVFGIESAGLDELISAKVTPELAGKWVGQLAVSPDRQWLAAAVGENIYDMESLWLVKLARES